MKRGTYNPTRPVTNKPISLRLMPAELRHATQIATAAGISRAKLARAAYLKGLPLLCKDLGLPPPLSSTEGTNPSDTGGALGLHNANEPIIAFAEGRATTEHYDHLTYMYELMMPACRHHNEAGRAACAEAKIALDNIRNRFARLKRMEANQQDLNRLRKFVNAYCAFWKRQPTGSYEAICDSLKDNRQDNVIVVRLDPPPD